MIIIIIDIIVELVNVSAIVVSMTSHSAIPQSIKIQVSNRPEHSTQPWSNLKIHHTYTLVIMKILTSSFT